MSQYLEKLIEAVPGVVYQFRIAVNGEWTFPYISGGTRELYELSPEVVRADPSIMLTCILEEDQEFHLRTIDHAMSELVPWMNDFRIRTPSGAIKWVRGRSLPERQEDGAVLWNGILVDITEYKQMEEKIWNLAYFDPLTNLPNRRMLLDRLAQALVRAKRHQNSLAIMFLDLDNFKTINDSLGHDVGDELLKEVSVRLKTCVRTDDTVSRHGGDEFIILLPEISRPEDAALVADKIIKAINASFQIADNMLNISTSIGIAVYPANGADDIQELLKKADRAMYAAKDAGRNTYRFFEMNTTAFQ